MWQSRIKGVHLVSLECGPGAGPASSQLSRLRVVALLGSGLIVCSTCSCTGWSLRSGGPGGLPLTASSTGNSRRKHADAVLFQKAETGSLPVSPCGHPCAEGRAAGMIKDLVQAARRLKLSVEAINSDIGPRRGRGGADHGLRSTFPAVRGPMPTSSGWHLRGRDLRTALWGSRDVKLGSEKGRVKMQMKLVTYHPGRAGTISREHWALAGRGPQRIMALTTQQETKISRWRLFAVLAGTGPVSNGLR